jgi:hypothetical protein
MHHVCDARARDDRCLRSRWVRVGGTYQTLTLQVRTSVLVRVTGDCVLTWSPVSLFYAGVDLFG